MGQTQKEGGSCLRHTRNLTQGNIYRQLLQLMTPLLVGNILQQFYNAADAWIIGRYVGQNAFAAVGVGGTVMNLFIFILSGCCSGFSVLFAQFYGAEDLRSFRKESYLSMVWGGGATIALSLTALLLLSPLLRLIHTPPEVLAECRAYLAIVCCGLAATYFYNLFAAILRAVGNTVAALAILFVSMALNVGLDFWFVAELTWGIRGAAWATVLAQALSALLCFFYVRRMLPELLFRREDAVLDRELLKKSLTFGLFSALHNSSLYIGKLLIQGAVNAMGTGMIAAYTATTRVEGFANSFGDSGGTAISIFIAQNIGNHGVERVKEGFRKGMKLMAVIGLTLSGILYVTATDSITLMTSQSGGPVVESGAAYLRVVAVFYILCFVGCTYVGWFRGLGMVNIPVIGTTFHITVRVILSWLLIGRMGLPAVALATGIGWMVVTSFQTLVYCFSSRQQNILNSGI